MDMAMTIKEGEIKMLENINNKIYESKDKAEIAEVTLEEYIDDYCEDDEVKERLANALEKIQDAMELLLEATNIMEGEEE